MDLLGSPFAPCSFQLLTHSRLICYHLLEHGHSTVGGPNVDS